MADTGSCKECGADNDGRAIECGYCGRDLARPYKGDPLAAWLRELDKEFRHKAMSHWFERLVFRSSLAVPIAVFAWLVTQTDWELVWAIAGSVSLLIVARSNR